MTTNKPEVVAWWDGELSITRNVGRPAAHNWHQRIDLIRLSDYERLQADHERLQAECDQLRKDADRFRFEHQNPDAMLEIELKALKVEVDIDWYRDAIDAAMQQEISHENQ